MKSGERPVLHVFNFETKFSREFFRFLQRHDFDLSRHLLFHYGRHEPDYAGFGFRAFRFARHYHSLGSHLLLLKWMFASERIIVHCLASPWLLLYLSLFPRLNRKVYWVVWGKDLYFYQLLDRPALQHRIYEWFRRNVFRRIGHVVTSKYDYRLLQQWYGVRAEYHECFMYPSNLFKELPVPPRTSGELCIQVGNSADSGNAHAEIFEQLRRLPDQDFRVFCPLAYGQESYRKGVLKLGHDYFGTRFEAQTEMLPFSDYIERLAGIDIAVFNQKRPQGMGNIITLLGLGKTVYIRKDATHWALLEEMGLKMLDCTGQVSAALLDDEARERNISIVRQRYSEESLYRGLVPLLVPDE